MTLGAILFILAVIYCGVIDTSWRGKQTKPEHTVDWNKYDVLRGDSADGNYG